MALAATIINRVKRFFIKSPDENKPIYGQEQNYIVHQTKIKAKFLRKIETGYLLKLKGIVAYLPFENINLLVNLKLGDDIDVIIKSPHIEHYNIVVEAI